MALPSGLEPQTRALVEQMKQGGFRPAHRIPIEESRAGLTEMAIAMAGPRQDVFGIEDRTIAGPGGELTLRIYRPRHPRARERLAAALYFHGGGFYLGNLETHDHVCRFLCRTADIVVIAVDYRLAPEHKFPAGVEDCYTATCWVADNAADLGLDAGRMAVVGDSAGGSLAVTTCLLARQRGRPAIACQVAVCPGLALDDGDDFPSRRELGSGDYFIAYEDFAFIRELYLSNPEREVADPLVSPIRAGDFSRLPPALLVTAEYDPCRDECARYAELLRDAGVPVEYKCFEGTIHPFFLFDGVLDIGRAGQTFVAERVGAALAPQDRT